MVAPQAVSTVGACETSAQEHALIYTHSKVLKRIEYGSGFYEAEHIVDKEGDMNLDASINSEYIKNEV